jgi:hypothetical protein
LNKNLFLNKKLKFDWKKYIIGLFAEVKNVSIADNEYILVDDWPYIEKAVKIFANYSKTRKRLI